VCVRGQNQTASFSADRPNNDTYPADRYCIFNNTTEPSQGGPWYYIWCIAGWYYRCYQPPGALPYESRPFAITGDVRRPIERF
jgi:hypothetical protein